MLGGEALPRAMEIPVDQHPDLKLHLPPHPTFETLNVALKTEEGRRRSADAAWCWVFIIVFFAIHIGRMRVYWDLVGMIDPLVAVVGDVLVVAMADPMDAVAVDELRLLTGRRVEVVRASQDDIATAVKSY